jgi:uncharacterized integral membrane protein
MASTQPGGGDTRVRVEKRGGSRGLGLLIALTVVIVLLLVFILQNTQGVEFSFLVFDFTVPAWSALLITLVLGFLAGLLTGAVLRGRRRR